MPLLHTLFGATLLFMPLSFLTFALIPFALPLHPTSSGLAANLLPALFGCGAVSLMSSSIPPIGQLIRSQDVIFDENQSSFLTPPPAPPAPSLHWSDFDPLPSAAPSPPPLPPAPAPPPLPACSSPPSAVISDTSPPASSSYAPMPPPLAPPFATLPSTPAPPPSPRLTHSRVCTVQFQHSVLFNRLSPSRNVDLLEDRFEELFSVHPVSPLLCVTIGDFSNSSTLLSVDTAAIPTPHTYSETLSGFHAAEWMAAIIAECEAFTRTHSYVDSAPPPGATVASPNVKALTTLPLTPPLPVSPLFASFLI
ncbi:unnamed protein product [Closterium sp. NIES-54]